MKNTLKEILLIILAYTIIILIFLVGFYKDLSDETRQKIWVSFIGLMGVYVLVVGGVYWSDYVELR